MTISCELFNRQFLAPPDLILGEVAAAVAFDTISDSLLPQVSEGRRRMVGA
jgi:hypothetical protein